VLFCYKYRGELLQCLARVGIILESLFVEFFGFRKTALGHSQFAESRIGAGVFGIEGNCFSQIPFGTGQVSFPEQSRAAEEITFRRSRCRLEQLGGALFQKLHVASLKGQSCQTSLYFKHRRS